MKVELEKMYSTEEIVKNKLFPYKGRDNQNVNEDSYRQLILRAIREGKLKAVNTEVKGIPRYEISGKSLLDYLKQYGKPRKTIITK